MYNNSIDGWPIHAGPSYLMHLEQRHDNALEERRIAPFSSTALFIYGAATNCNGTLLLSSSVVSACRSQPRSGAGDGAAGAGCVRAKQQGTDASSGATGTYRYIEHRFVAYFAGGTTTNRATLT